MKNGFKRIVSAALVMALLNVNAAATEEIENNSSAATQTEAEVEIEMEKSGDIVDVITGNLTSLLDPENNEMEERMSQILEENKDNWFVKLFKRIIDAISSFLNAVLELASQATKIEVDKYETYEK